MRWFGCYSLSDSAREAQSVTASALSSIDSQKRELDMVAAAMNEMTSTVIDVARNASSRQMRLWHLIPEPKKGNRL